MVVLDRDLRVVVVENYIVSHNLPHIGEKIMSVRAKFIQSPDPTLKLILMTIQDITDQKRLEQALKTRISEWQKIFDSTLDAIICAYCRPENYKGTGCPGKALLEVVHSTDKPVSMCPFLKMVKSVQREYIEMSVGNMVFEVTVDLIFDQYNTFIGAINIIRDITKIKQIEKQLSISEERYRLITEHLPDMVVIHYYRDVVKERIKRLLVNKGIAEPLEEKFIKLNGKIIDVEEGACLLSLKVNLQSSTLSGISLSVRLQKGH